MKARVIATGKIVEVIRNSAFDKETLYTAGGGAYKISELDFEVADNEHTHGCDTCVFSQNTYCGLKGFTKKYPNKNCSAWSKEKPDGYNLQSDGYFDWDTEVRITPDSQSSKTIDYWTRLEHQAAIAAMQGLLQCPHLNIIQEELLVANAAELAHALVEKMKEVK